MKEVEPDKQFDVPEPVLETKPTEAELVIIALLMRLYDINLALLTHFDSSKADAVYKGHEEGLVFGPKVFIPEMKHE